MRRIDSSKRKRTEVDIEIEFFCGYDNSDLLPDVQYLMDEDTEKRYSELLL